MFDEKIPLLACHFDFACSFLSLFVLPLFYIMKKLLAYFLFIINFPFVLSGEESFYFRHLSVEDGLPQNTVNCIIQDQQGFMWFGTRDGLSRYDGYTFRNFRQNPKDKNSIGNNFIRCLYQEKDGIIWIGTDTGIYLYHPNTEFFSHFDLKTAEGIGIEGEVNDIKSDKDGNLWFAATWQGVFHYKLYRNELILYKENAIVSTVCISIEKDNQVWTGTLAGDLNRYDRTNGCFETILDRTNTGGEIHRLFQNNYNDLLIGASNDGVKKLSLIDLRIKPLLEPEKKKQIFVRDIIRKSDNELFIGTESGLFVYSMQNQTVRHLFHDPFDPYSLSDNAVYSIYKDREGGFWIGTYFGGVNYYPPQHAPFVRFYPHYKKNSLQGKRVREFQQDQYGNLWIGTEDNGLNYYNPQTKVFKHFMPSGAGSIVYHNIHGLLADGDRLWMGTFMHGIDIIDIKTQRVIRHYQKTENQNSLCDNSVYSIYKDNTGNIWLGTIHGLSLYEPQQDRFTKVDFVGNMSVINIFQSYDGMLWIAPINCGLFRYNPHTKGWKVFRHDPDDPGSLAHNKIISIYEDRKKNLWFTSEGGGICKYHPDSETFTSYTTRDGLPNNVVYKMLEDNMGSLWLTSNNGLSCFNPDNGAVKTYTRVDGLLGDQFNYKSGYKTPDGRLYFGGLNGFIAFDPLSFTENEVIPPVVITGFRLFDREDETGTLNSILTSSIYNRKEVCLKHDQSSFTIDFAALSYVAPEKNSYSYILEGFEDKWTQSTGKHSVTYSNVPPGKYVFRLKGSNNDGKWNDDLTSLTIHIQPPFYKTSLAFAVYILSFLFFVAWIIITSKKRLEQRNRRKLEQFEIKKNEEIYNAKIAFFTNIVHEIRTPLSLIKAPVEYIFTHKPDMDDEIKQNLKVVEKNTNRLHDLSNQLLDFRKMEAKGFRLNYMRSDILQLINDIYIRFTPSSQQKELSFKLQLPQEAFFADIDREAFTKIISNLFTNAIKYAKSEIVLVLKPEENQFFIRVISDGELIPEKMKEKIFEPFFRVEDKNGVQTQPGTGLGLPLSRSLAELHGGKLYLEILPERRNNIFVLQLPSTQSSSITIGKESTEQKSAAQPVENADPGNLQNKQTLLLVEDDKDMLDFVYNQLKSDYTVFKAVNGKIALECLQKENFDIVVTDITMPEMDGLQLCSHIKSNVDTSHIPVIMLTAKSDIPTRIESLDMGADAYVEKPFSIAYLLAQIANILVNRNKIKQAFINSPTQHTGSIALTKADEIFLGKVTDIIHKNLQNTEFNADHLAEALNMSRSSLYRKIKGISELSPNDFIQLVRLKKANELLQEGSYRINEVCFLVGFVSSSHFSKSFRKQFGISPKESRNK